jgi:putative peptidoglycan lipid II flippase
VLLGVTIASLVVIGLAVLFAPEIVAVMASKYAGDDRALAIELTRWLMPFLLCVAWVSFAEGLLNQRGHFFVPKLAPGLVSAGIVVAALWAKQFDSPPVFALVVGTLVGGVVHVLVCLPPLFSLWGRVWPSWAGTGHPKFKYFLREMGKVIAIGLFAQLNIFVLRTVALFLEDGAVSWYWYANRVVDLAQGVVAIAVGSALLPTITRNVVDRNWDGFRDSFGFGVRLTSFGLLLAAAMLIAVAGPICSVLFLHGATTPDDVWRIAELLRAFVPYLLVVGGINLIKRAYYALDDRRTLLWVGGAGVGLTAVLGVGLSLGEMPDAMRWLPGLPAGAGWGAVGLIWALNISCAAQLALYVLRLRGQVSGGAGIRSLIGPISKMCVAAVPAGLVAWGICSFGDWSTGPSFTKVLVLGLALAGGSATYAAVAWGLRLRELRVAVDRIRARLGK